MESLASLIQQNKEKYKDISGEKKWTTGKDVVRKGLEKVVEGIKNHEKLLKKEEDRRLQNLRAHLEIHGKQNSQKYDNADEIYNVDGNEFKFTSIDGENDVPPMNKAEVQAELRKLREPITLFGETDLERYARLCSKLVSKHVDKEVSVGQQNAFANFMKSDRSDRKRNKYDEDDEDIEEEEEERESLKKLKDSKSHERCRDCEKKDPDNVKEDENESDECSTVIKWIKDLLKDWEDDLCKKKETDINNKRSLAFHRQTRKDLKPLLKKLKRRLLEKEIIDKLYSIVGFCMKREYVEAHDKYIELAIGNAAWPMGVTMVGIHERAGRAKIYTSEVAHILNDETTRKYIQMIKRLMSYSQKKYPADFSKMVQI